MEKLYASKTFLKMAGGRMYTPGPHSTFVDPPLAISCKNHRKSLAFLLKGRVKKRSMAQCSLLP